MFTPEELERLELFDGGQSPVLTVYLDLDPARQVRRSYRIAFEDLVKEAREPLPEAARADLAREVATVQAWLEKQEPHGKGLMVVSCAPTQLWHASFLRVRVADHLAFEPRPDVGPLLELVDEHERYAVVVVDKDEARVFTVFLGEIEAVEEFREDALPARTDQGGLSQSKYQRHHDTHVHWHLKRVAQRLAEVYRRRRFDRVILAGPEEATAALRRLLARTLAPREAATVPAKVFATDEEILALTHGVETRLEREAEERLLGELLDLAGPGGRAVLGLMPTLDALWADLVQTLVMAHGVGGEGSECPNCGRLEPGRVETCPACGRAMRTLHDLYHRAMLRARQQAGSVEIMHGAAGRRLQEAGGGLGALLRYRWG